MNSTTTDATDATDTETATVAVDKPDEPDGPDVADVMEAPRRRWPRVLGVLLTVALTATGAALYAEGRQLRDTPATANLALTDAEATARVTGDVSSALGKIFSYGPGATTVTRAAAKEVLAGKALQQYAALFGQVERQSTDQKLTLTTEVVRAGVTRLTGSSAHLLVFLDQVYERRGRAPTTASAQLTVTAELRDGRWWIVEIGST
ncbi:nuclear transport factor 2 family protein [Streptomyces sp. CMC78]|uniref:Nuclear transport factor 2 family protein n=1 Tax=Streptomyces sp. CMC78 TaxID=3231512 RepID=A0AB33KAC7_9ACTN